MRLIAGILLFFHVCALDATLQVAGREVEVTVAAVSSVTTRVSVSPVDRRIADETVLALSAQPRVYFRSRELFSSRTLSGLRVRTAPLQFAWTDGGGSPLLEIAIDTVTGHIRFGRLDAPLFGLGQGGQPFDRRGAAYPLVNGRGPWSMAEYAGYVPMPWLVSASGWAILFHQPFSGKLDLTGPEGRLEPADPLPIDLFVVRSPSPERIMAEYALLTGAPSLPPVWTLGYQQSHRTLAGPDEVLGVAKMFREKRLPCDVLMYLGTGFTPSGWNTGHGSFEFNPVVFPRPVEMLRELGDLNFHVVLHVTNPPKTLDLGGAREYWKRHEPAMQLGVAGWWPDVGEELSMASRLMRVRMYGEGIPSTNPNVRPYALHRTGYAGMQHYGAWLWSGDVYSTWELLSRQVPIGLNTSLSGVPFWGTDTGGFWSTRELTGELYVRWFQFSTFCPLFRSHGRAWKTRLPWGWNTGELGPEETEARPPGQAPPDRSELRNPQVEPICRKYLELRYRLLPYLYSVVKEASETGLPVMRALWLHYPRDPVAVSRGDEYLWGPEMLVAPVTVKSATSRPVYLPSGLWHDFWTEELVEGGREIQRAVTLETLPLYVRAGAIVPFGPLKQHTLESVDANLAVVVYPGADGHFVLYEDDGISQDHTRGVFSRTAFRWNDRRGVLRIEAAGGSWRRGLTRNIEVRLAGGRSAQSVRFHGRPLALRSKGGT